MNYAAILLCCLFLVSCGGSGWAERAANDRIMLVREAPPTLGFRRLEQQSARHPSLTQFMGKRGRPDFVAETHSDDRHYMVLYYLERKVAYAARSWRGQPTMEFAGPYPISDEETKILGDLKNDSMQGRPVGGASGRSALP